MESPFLEPQLIHYVQDVGLPSPSRLYLELVFLTLFFYVLVILDNLYNSKEVMLVRIKHVSGINPGQDHENPLWNKG